MRATKAILILAVLALAAISCSKAITVLLINRSDRAITVDDHGKQISFESGEMVSYIPELQDDHDISIRSGAERYFYRLANTPTSFLDIQHNKRMLFVFAKDHKLYLLKPTDKPLNAEIEVQPSGYPLIPK